MAVSKVVLYRHFDKRNNSTAIPGDLSHGISCAKLEKDGELVEGCDILNPSFSFKFNPEELSVPGYPVNLTNQITTLNYAHVEDFSRYYFIKNWRHEYGLWIAEMVVDVLASYKNSLDWEKNEFYILRSASHKNGNIVDNIYPLTCDYKIVENKLTYGSGYWGTDGDASTGYYVVGIVNSDTNTIGTVSYYVFKPDQMRSFMSKLMGNFSWLNVGDVSEELTKALVNPFQYVVSCMWFPTHPNMASTSTVKYGWWNFSTNAWRMTKSNYSDLQIGYFKPVKHPDNNSAENVYLNLPPYTTTTCFFEPWGVFDIAIPPDSSTVNLSASVDFITGLGILKVWRNATSPTGETVKDILAYKQAQVGVPIQISQMTTNVLGVAETAVNTVGGTLGNLIHGNVGGAISSASSGIISAVEESFPKLSTKGANGSFISYAIDPKVLTRFRNHAETDNNLFGSPLCEKRKISELRGFVQCAKPSVQLTGATETERAEFNSLLESGIYYE